MSDQNSPAQDLKEQKLPTDEDILAFEEEIRQKEVKTTPLLGKIEPIQSLKDHYRQGSPAFTSKLEQLEQRGYRTFRKCRGDGNCFYRAFAFLVLEYLIDHPDKVQRNLDRLYDNRGAMLTVGFQEFAFGDFEEEFKGFMECIPALVLNGREAAVRQLEESFNSDMISNSIVVYMRLLTSAYMKMNADSYIPFLEDGQTIDIFCSMQVEAMDRYNLLVIRPLNNP